MSRMRSPGAAASASSTRPRRRRTSRVPYTTSSRFAVDSSNSSCATPDGASRLRPDGARLTVGSDDLDRDPVEAGVARGQVDVEGGEQVRVDPGVLGGDTQANAGGVVPPAVGDRDHAPHDL